MSVKLCRLFAPWTLVLGLILAGPAAALPKIQTWQTPNGAKVLFVEAPDLPMLDLRLVFDAGSARDAGQPGVATMTADMLTQGAGDWDADALAERMENVGASLSTAALRDMGVVAVRTLTREPALDTALDTLAKVLAEPRFGPADLERLRRNALTGLRQAEQDPGTVGQKALYRAIYGDHPYAEDPSGTPEGIAALTRDDLIAFYHRYYSARNAVVAMVGAIDRSQAEAIATRVTAGLPGGPSGGEHAPPPPPVPELAAASSDPIDFTSSQTHVLIGQPGMQRGDPDYFPLYVGNHVLGGSGLVSLLMDEVREKRGLSYSVYSYFLPMRVDGPFLMGLQTKNDQADQAREVLLSTLRRFITEGPTEQELIAAKKNLTGGFPLRIASNAQVVQYLAMMGFYNLPLDYLDRFTSKVEAVTAEQVRDAFSRRVHPDRLASVIVGPKGGEGQEPPVAQAVAPASGQGD
jgi:zinc protease